MCSRFKAAVILAAPVLAAARPFTQQGPAKLCAQLFRFDILESEAACGYGNITLDGQALHQDESGLGSGSIITERGNNVVAKWKFTCIERDDGYQEQLLNFNVITVDEKFQDVEYAVQFRQVAPVAITSLKAIGGAQYMIRVPESGSDKAGSIDQSTPVGLEEELDVLELMKLRVLDLERAIARKEQYLSETFNFRGNSAGDVSTLAEWQAFSDRLLHDPHSEGGVSHVSEDEQRGEPQGSQVSGTTFDAEIFDTNSQEHPLQAPIDDVGLSIPPPPTPGRKEAFPAGSPPSDGLARNNLIDTKLTIFLLVGVVVLGLVVSAIHTRCFASAREGHRAHREACRNRRRMCSEKRATRRDALKAALRRWVQRLHDRIQRWRQQRWGRSIGDEEKEVAMPHQPPRPHHQPQIETPTTEEDKPEQRYEPSSSDSGDSGDESDGSDGSDLSTTMEQELAQFRAVAGVVSDLVAAEEGRRSRAVASAARSRLPALASTYRYDIYARAGAGAEPPSPISVSSCPPEYASSDETLPPYDEGPSDPRFVADGFMYVPGTATYTPGNGSEAPSSLDEHLGRLG
ncbi:hypothetical protein DL769_006105 [Monosporascus sp. CRB-8-3]|nr:hypothetical protein DL769_006105 [Monosporascus sp. CRB-8-3]